MSLLFLSALLVNGIHPRNTKMPSKTGSLWTLWLDLNPEWQLKEQIAKSRRSETNGGTSLLFEGTVCGVRRAPEKFDEEDTIFQGGSTKAVPRASRHWK